MSPLVYFRYFLGLLVALPALVMPYRLRMKYIGFLSVIIHLPLKLFGNVAHYLLRHLAITPMQSLPEISSPQVSPYQTKEGKVCILYSGGSDSTCVASLAAKKFKTIHLLTFFEGATRNSPFPTENTRLLKERYPDTEFLTFHYDVDEIVKFLSYENYLTRLKTHGLLVLATCAYSSLSWHVQMIRHCRQHGIHEVQDGLTRELMHFPGHMDEFIGEIRKLYSSFGITYSNPVREWPVPPDQQFIDQVIVNSHASEYFLGDPNKSGRKTTGRYLFNEGIFPSPDVKGSRWDFLRQHDCYPFALYNILAFWNFLPFTSYPVFCRKVTDLMIEKIESARERFLA